ncbi:MAG: DUF4358 domain-containing protein [Ruminococcus sp.]
MEKTYTLTEVLENMNAECNISPDEMKVIEDKDSLDLYYSIAPEDVASFAAETTKNSAEDVTEIILIEAVDSDAASRVYDKLMIRYNSQRDLCASYSPELLAVVDESKVEIHDNIVSLIISENYSELSACFKEHVDYIA